MAVVGVLVDGCEDVEEFVCAMSDKLGDNNLVSNPFRGRVRRYPVEGGVLVVLVISPVYFNFSVFGWVVGAIFYFIRGWNWYVMGAAAGLVCLGVFWSSWFYGVMLKAGLKKWGYRGKIKKLSRDEIVDSLISVVDRGAG